LEKVELIENNANNKVDLFGAMSFQLLNKRN